MGSSYANDSEAKFVKFDGQPSNWRAFTRNFRALLRRKYNDISMGLFCLAPDLQEY